MKIKIELDTENIDDRNMINRWMNILEESQERDIVQEHYEENERADTQGRA